MIKQVPTYAKFLKDLCTIKRGLGIDKKAFLTERVSAIIQSKTQVKYKDLGSPTFSVNIGVTCVDKALLDLGTSVNLLPYSVYKQLGLGELKPTTTTLSLDDRSVKIPKGIVEDVLVKVDKFYYPVDFVVLDIEPVARGTNHVPIILGRPFLATSNAIINFQIGVMQLTFGNMTLELNIFYLSSKHKSMEEQEVDEVYLISPGAGKHSVHKLQEELMKNNEESNGESSASVTPPALLIPLAPLEGIVLKTKGQKLKSIASHLTSDMEGLLLLDQTSSLWRSFSVLFIPSWGSITVSSPLRALFSLFLALAFLLLRGRVFSLR